MIVGGGFIGVEVASSLASRGVAVTVVELASALWGGVLGDELSDWAAARLRGAGVVVWLGARASRLDPAQVWVGEERMPADLVVAGVGVMPSVELATAAGLEAHDGIVVDQRQATSQAGIFAAGDVAAAPHPLAGGARIRVEHWHAAREAAERAALAMLGEELPTARAPWFFSEVTGVALDVVGWAPDWDRIERLGSGDAFSLAYLRAGHVAQIAVVGSHLPVETVRTWVERHATLADVRRLAG